MDNRISYSSDREELSQQKMQMTVVNLRPQYPPESRKTVENEIKAQLFQIFQKYEGSD